MSAALAAPNRSPDPSKRLVTGEELLQHPEWGPCELIRGKVVPVCRPNYMHGVLMSEMGGELRAFVKKRKLGDVVVGDSGVYLERGPDTVRGPDVYFISAKRKPEKQDRAGYLKVAPELCVEIVSPSDKWSDIKGKVDQFLAFGVKLVWVIDPKTRSAHVYRAGGSVVAIGPGGVLSGEQILPGFELPLKELFAAVD
jgi:Uma2 family endonuclease